MKQYDELHVVSDLHLGGKPDFQIFDQGKELAGLIDLLRERPKERTIGLVLNGDVVDFLAEPNADYLDPVGVVVRLRRIVEQDSSFSMVWEALARFVHEDNRELVFVLGNHDVELALPAAKEYLLQRLCQSSSAARGRVFFATDGAGFTCQVNGRKVLCVHGNEVDTWNLVDHSQLLEVSQALNRSNTVPEWVPNAGTRLVIDIMNDIKQEQPFVDLLKPETKVVPAILLATDKKIAEKLYKLAPVLLRLGADGIRHRTGFLSDNFAPMNSEDALQELLRPGFSMPPKVVVEDEDALFRRVEERFQQGSSHAEFGEVRTKETLGIPGMILDRFLSRDPVENLREALANWLGSDRTFDVNYEDEDTFQPLDREIGADIDFIVAGHTHLHRSLKRKRGSGVYFNSGSWIRLIKIQKESLKDTATFRPVFNMLRAMTMQELDKSGLIERRPTVVSIETIGDRTVGELRYMRLTPQPYLEVIPNSRREV